MKRNEQTRAGLGAASMLLILLVMCLALLGVLSLISARNDLRLSERDVLLAQSYAQAAENVQIVLMELDTQLHAAWLASEDEAQYEQACTDIARAGDADVHWMDAQSVSMTFDAGYERQIVVYIRRSAWADAQNTRFQVVRHTLEDTSIWEQTDGLLLMGL